jgi:hypothetical protein
MARASAQPKNINYFIPTGFRFQINQIPNVNYFCQSANLPGLSVGVATQATPFKDISRQGDKALFNELRISFIVDEELRNWLEIYDWLVGYSFPKKFEQYKKIVSKGYLTSDAVLMILSSHKNIQYKVTFTDCFPTDLSDIDMTVATTDTDIVLADTTFVYTNYNIERMIGDT